MTELLIIPDKGELKTYPVLLLAIMLLFIIANSLNQGLDTVTLAALGFIVVLIALMFWNLYVASKTRILINKTTKQIEVISYSFFGTRQESSYPIMYFGSIRSYISFGGGARNVVELITNDGNRSLHLSSFLPHGGKKLWSLKMETENPEAENLVMTVANFIPVQNLGFVGHQFGKFPIEIKEDNFIKNMFK